MNYFRCSNIACDHFVLKARHMIRSAKLSDLRSLDLVPGLICKYSDFSIPNSLGIIVVGEILLVPTVILKMKILMAKTSTKGSEGSSLPDRRGKGLG